MESFLPTLKVSKPCLLIATTEMVDFLRNKLTTEQQNIFAGLEIVSDKEILAEKNLEYTPPELHKNDTA